MDLNEVITNVIGPTQDLIDDNVSEIMALDGLMDNQIIIGDYFYMNQSDIVLNQSSTMLTEWEFCVPAGATFEFHMTLADFAGLNSAGTGLGMNTFVLNVDLVRIEGGIPIPVAKSNQNDGQRGHQHNLLFKDYNSSGSTQQYAIQV